MSRFSKFSLSTFLLACLCFTCSCSQNENGSQKLKVGTVDVLRVMEGRPETVDIRLDWATQAGSTYLELADVQDKEQAASLRQEIEKRSAAWQKRMDAFMEESIGLVESEAKVIAKERGIDIVVVDNTLTETVKFQDGEDLTLDVQFNLQDRDN